MSVVLVVDDVQSIRTGLMRLLRAHGYEVLDAASSESALAIANEKRPDVIILDLHMPGHSGVDTALALRSNPELAQTPLIAFTATPPRDEATIRLFNAVLEKPCNAAELMRALSAALRR